MLPAPSRRGQEAIMKELVVVSAAAIFVFGVVIPATGGFLLF